jgi:hypothetical protein
MIHNPYATPQTVLESGQATPARDSIAQIYTAIPFGFFLGIFSSLSLFGGLLTGTPSFGAGAKPLAIMILTGAAIAIFCCLTRRRAQFGVSAGVFFGQFLYWILAFKTVVGGAYLDSLGMAAHRFLFS